MLKTKFHPRIQTTYTDLDCYKIIRKSHLFKTVVEDGDPHNDRFHTIYETLFQSFDVTEYVTGGKTWVLPSDIPEEIRHIRTLGIFPKESVVNDGFIFSYSEKGITDFIDTYKRNRHLYGEEHFNHDLVVYRCVIPAGMSYYQGNNNGYEGFASRRLRFIEEVKF